MARARELAGPGRSVLQTRRALGTGRLAGADLAVTLRTVSEARLLLVDDDLPHLDALAERLAGDGFEVAQAGSGAEALDRLDAAWPDLVILDLMMPEMDGQTLAGRIKSRADIPILVLSAVAAADSKADLIAHFAEDYVTKPYDYAELVARIGASCAACADQIPVEELALGDLTLVPRGARGDRPRPARAALPDRIALPGDPRREHAAAPSRPSSCSARSGPIRTPRILPMSGSPCAGFARRSRSTPTTRATC